MQGAQLKAQSNGVARASASPRVAVPKPRIAVRVSTGAKIDPDKLQSVLTALALEHEHRDHGHSLVYSCRGIGRAASVGREIEHVGNLSGVSLMSSDYSYFK